MKNSIRNAKISDAKRINQLLNTDPHLSFVGNKTDYNIEDVKEFIKSKINKTLVYEEDGKVVGVIIVQFWKTYSYLHLIVVDKKYQKKGIGTLLIKEIEKQAKERKIEIIEGITETDNQNMQALFTKLNYAKGNTFFNYLKQI